MILALRAPGRGISLLGFECALDTRSIFADSDAIRQIHPLGRIPALVLDDGEGLIDSAAILDWLDQKVGAAAYERLARPAALRWPEWMERCHIQEGAIAAVAAEPWPERARLSQAEITTACTICYVRMADPDLLPPGRFPTLDALSRRCKALPASSRPAPPSTCCPKRLRASTVACRADNAIAYG